MLKTRILNAHTAFGLLAFALCLGATTPAQADSTAAIQMLPPTIAGSTSSSGCGTNSVLSLNLSPTTGSAINCSTTTAFDSSGNFTTTGSVTTSGTFKLASGAGGYNFEGGNAKFFNTLSAYNITTLPQGNDSVFDILGADGYTYQAFGTYSVWDGNLSTDAHGNLNRPIFIAGYNATNATNINSAAVSLADSVVFGGYGYLVNSTTTASPAMLVNLKTHSLGINNDNPQYTLDVNGSANVTGGANVTGALTTGSISATGATTPLTGNDINVLHALETESCPSGKVLVGIGASATCMAVDTATIPTVPTVPNCPSGQVVTANGSSYSCVPQTAAAPTPAVDCTGANVLQWNAATSQYQCVSISSLTGGTGANCPVGYYVPTSAPGSNATAFFQYKYAGTSQSAAFAMSNYAISVGESATTQDCGACGGTGLLLQISKDLAVYTLGMASGQNASIYFFVSGGKGSGGSSIPVNAECYNGQITIVGQQDWYDANN